MPKLVELEVNPEFKPATDEEREALRAMKARKFRPTAYVTARENIRFSRGMLRIKPAAPKGTVKIETNLDDMPNDQLMLMMLSLGVKPTKKQMIRQDIITVIRNKVAEIEVIDAEE